jgi:type IV pilus assembly protein PilO
MHPIIENFLDRSTAQKTGIVAVVALLLGGGFFQFGLSPYLEERSQLLENKQTLEQQLATERRIARNLPKYEEEVKALEVKLRLALQELPDRKQIDQLLASVSDLARKAGLEVSLFKPDSVVPRDFYEEVPVLMSVEGTYHQVATFFDEVGRMDRIVNIRCNVSILGRIGACEA